MLFLLLGMAGSWLFGLCVEGTPSPAACILCFCGGCIALVLLLSLLLHLYALAEALVAPAGEGEMDAAGGGWRLLAIALPLAMGGGLLCKEFGTPEALGWWLKGILAVSATLLTVFLILLALAWLRRHCR